MVQDIAFSREVLSLWDRDNPVNIEHEQSGHGQEKNHPDKMRPDIARLVMALENAGNEGGGLTICTLLIASCSSLGSRSVCKG